MVKGFLKNNHKDDNNTRENTTEALRTSTNVMSRAREKGKLRSWMSKRIMTREKAFMQAQGKS